MKKNIVLIITICFFTSIANAQFIKAAIPIGINASQVDGDELAGFNKLGLHTGVGAYVWLDTEEKWEMGFEIIYHETGSRSTNKDFINLKNRFNYISIPIVVNYLDEGKGILGAGLSFNRLVKEEIILDGLPFPVSDTLFRKNDFSIFGQIGYAFNPNSRITLRYSYSILPISKKFGAFPTFNSNFPIRPRINAISIRYDIFLSAFFN